MRSGPQDFVTFRLSSSSLTSSMMIESKGAWVEEHGVVKFYFHH